MSVELSDIEAGLREGLAAAEGMRARSTHWSGREAAENYASTITRALQACEKLRRDLRDGRKHIEPPDDWTPTSCYCNTPACSPPCGWCTDPERAATDAEGK